LQQNFAVFGFRKDVTGEVLVEDSVESVLKVFTLLW